MVLNHQLHWKSQKLFQTGFAEGYHTGIKTGDGQHTIGDTRFPSLSVRISDDLPTCRNDHVIESRSLPCTRYVTTSPGHNTNVPVRFDNEDRYRIAVSDIGNVVPFSPVAITATLPPIPLVSTVTVSLLLMPITVHRTKGQPNCVTFSRDRTGCRLTCT